MNRRLQEAVDLFQRPDMQQLAQQIHVIVPHRPIEGVSADITEAFMLWMQGGIQCNLQKDAFGGHIEKTRAHIAKLFLESSDREWLLMLDDDMVPLFDLPLALAAHNRPVISAVCASSSIDNGIMAVFAVEAEDGTLRFPYRPTKLPAEGLLDVKFVGTGALMVHRSILEQFDYDNDPPFSIPTAIRNRAVTYGRMACGEDFAFCYQLAEMGVPICVDLGCRVGHRKIQVLTWEHFDDGLEVENYKIPAIGPEIGQDADLFRRKAPAG